MRERDAHAVSRETKTSHVTPPPLPLGVVRGPRVSGTRDANTAASLCRENARLWADWRAAPFRFRGDSHPVGDTAGWERPAKKWRGEREWNTRVHGRNSMNWYRLAAHFVPRSRSCGWLVKRSDPFLPPLSLRRRFSSSALFFPPLFLSRRG